jgi:hypothetical protein
MMSTSRLYSILSGYLSAKEIVLRLGFSAEIDWQYDRDVRTVDTRTFLSEYAWVVLCCGMRETTVRRAFAGVEDAFMRWNVDAIRSTGIERCGISALRSFGHPGKIEAIAQVISTITNGAAVIDEIMSAAEPLRILRELPFIGPVTVYHLAKNLGIQVCKPDRHLVRLAKTLGFETVDELCHTIADHVGEKVSVVDVVLWRYLSITSDYSLEQRGLALPQAPETRAIFA